MMRSSELSKKEIIEVFRKNFKFQIVDTILGEAVRMPSKDAFIFCNVTGSGYFNNTVMPFSPKGLMKLFDDVPNYNFVTGLFEDTSLKYTPFYLNLSKSFLFDTDYKKVVPIEFSSEEELRTFLEDRFYILDNPTEFIIMRVETSKKGNGLENFMEYLTAEFFKRRGFIVENQIPLAQAFGSPDFGGYHLSSIQEALDGKLPHGFHLIELAMLRLKTKGLDYSSTDNYPNTLIVGEAKTSTKIMNNQLNKYLNTGAFDWGFEIHPNKQKAHSSDLGLLTIDNNYKLLFTAPNCKYVPQFNPYISKKKYIVWLENYMKFYLLANLSNEELLSFYKAKTGSIISNQKNLVSFVDNLSPIEIINHIFSL